MPKLRYQFQDQHQPPLTAGITVDQAGTLYATLFGDNGIVAEYPAGDTTQAAFTLSPPLPYSAIAVAVDRQNNLYMEYTLNAPFPETAYIEKCLPQSDQCTDLGVELGLEAGTWRWIPTETSWPVTSSQVKSMCSRLTAGRLG